MRATHAVNRAVLVFVALLGCGKDGPTSSGARVSRDRLNGQYTCAEFQGFFAGPQGPGLYEGTCDAYVSATRPSRRDSIELAPFSIGEDNTLSRQEFFGGAIAYDSVAAKLTVTSADQPVERYDVVLQGSTLFLIRTFDPFDFSGDGLMDELVLVYRRR